MLTYRYTEIYMFFYIVSPLGITQYFIYIMKITPYLEKVFAPFIIAQYLYSVRNLTAC